MVAFGFVLGEVVRRVTGRNDGPVPAHRGSPNRWVSTSTSGCCPPSTTAARDMINKPHIRDVASQRRLRPATPPARPSIRWPDCPSPWVSSPMTNSARTTSPRRSAEFSPAPTVTFSSGLAHLLQTVWLQEKLSAASSWNRSGVPGRVRPRRRPRAAGGRSRLGLGYMLNQRGGLAESAQASGHGGSGGSTDLVDPSTVSAGCFPTTVPLRRHQCRPAPPSEQTGAWISNTT